MVQRIPHRGNVDGTVGMDIEISGVLYDTPRNGGILLLDLIGELGNQFRYELSRDLAGGGKPRRCGGRGNLR